MEKLTKLTPEQKKIALEVRNEWLDLFFSCETKLNKKKAKEGIEWLYKQGG